MRESGVVGSVTSWTDMVLGTEGLRVREAVGSRQGARRGSSATSSSSTHRAPLRRARVAPCRAQDTLRVSFPHQPTLSRRASRRAPLEPASSRSRPPPAPRFEPATRAWRASRARSPHQTPQHPPPTSPRPRPPSARTRTRASTSTQLPPRPRPPRPHRAPPATTSPTARRRSAPTAPTRPPCARPRTRLPPHRSTKNPRPHPAQPSSRTSTAAARPRSMSSRTLRRPQPLGTSLCTTPTRSPTSRPRSAGAARARAAPTRTPRALKK